MKRYHDEINRTRRQWRDHYRQHVEANKNRAALRVGQDPRSIDCVCDGQVGRFRKTDAHDCGKTCWACHPHKVPYRTPSVGEIKSLESFREQVEEL